MVHFIYDTALSTLPRLKVGKKKKTWYNDKTLAAIAKEKKAAWDEWKEVPYMGHCMTRNAIHKRPLKAFKQRLSLCAASVQRKKVQTLDNKFRKNDPSRFKLPRKNNQQGSTLMVNGEICSDTDTVLEAWSNHFKSLSSSHDSQFPALAKAKKEYEQLRGKSLDNDEDTPFTLEETEGVIKCLKTSKCGGIDGLQAEHLKFGGKSLVLWVQQVCNAIVELETVPDAMKLGVVRPIYKGGGRDPLDTNSYRGITLSSVLSKTLELLLLRRFQETLSESQFPHLNQTGFVKKTSCADAICSSHLLPD